MLPTSAELTSWWLAVHEGTCLLNYAVNIWIVKIVISIDMILYDTVRHTVHKNETLNIVLHVSIIN